MKHTPTWKALEQFNTGWDVFDANGACVASYCSKADARLIAASPMMLAALRALDNVLDFSEEYGFNEATVVNDPTAINEAFALARTAIRSATDE